MVHDILLNAREANVFMEVTAANVQTLFNFVQVQAADPEAFADSGSGSSARRNRPFLSVAIGVCAGRIRKAMADKQHNYYMLLVGDHSRRASGRHQRNV